VPLQLNEKFLSCDSFFTDRLRARDQWIGWSEEQRRRRLPLIANNCRFLLLPDKTFPNLASRSLSLASHRLSADWQIRYGHPVVVVETFVDPEQFCGTVYSASGWQELGQTDGFGRVRRDFYVQHNKPKHPAFLAVSELRSAKLQLRVADAITAFAGSMRFVYLHALVFAVWMLVFEKSPWPTLTLIVSLEAIFLSTFVMIGQNRQASFQQAKADHDFVASELELHTNTELTTLTNAFQRGRAGRRVDQAWTGPQVGALHQRAAFFQGIQKTTFDPSFKH